MTIGSSNDPESTASPVGFAHHDHTACVIDGLSAAETRCTDEGLRFTPVRRKVLELLLQEHRALELTSSSIDCVTRVSGHSRLLPTAR
jgi:Fur family zinc uptake transcriptional regulator